MTVNKIVAMICKELTYFIQPTYGDENNNLANANQIRDTYGNMSLAIHHLAYNKAQMFFWRMAIFDVRMTVQRISLRCGPAG